ncbi:MAG: hypothetical protein Q9225_000142 [Loekoesia sp. 1 TL-2023]
MSGAEVAGIAIALLPILISAAEHYNDCIKPILRYRKVAKDVQLFQRSLEVHKTIFRNQCRILLEGVVDHDDTLRMLEVGSLDPSWRNTGLEARLAKQFGSSKEACVTSIELINEKLQSIAEESRRLQDIVDTEKEVKHRLVKKILFCLSKSPLEKYISSLRDLNDDFIKISNQVTKADALRVHRDDPPPKIHDKAISKYTAVREASEKVYQALSRACTKHSEHLALFCFNPMWDTYDTNSSLEVKFRIAITRIPLAAAAYAQVSDQAEPIWFMIDTVSAGAVVFHSANSQAEGKINGEPSFHPVSHNLKRELDIAAPQPTRKTRKTVRSRTPDDSESLEISAKSPMSELSSIPRLRKDFCDILRNQVRHVSPLCMSYSCLGILENTGNVKHRIYAPPIDICYRSRHKISLNELIASRANHDISDHLSTLEKLRLAKTLAVTVLQYYSTPWLDSAWRSTDIFFFDTDRAKGSQKALDLSSPHVNVKVKELNEPIDDSRETAYPEFFVAKRLATTVVREMGRTYGKIVKKLLQCDFGCGDDLNDPSLRSMFHKDVVCELERLEQEFSELSID